MPSAARQRRVGPDPASQEVTPAPPPERWSAVPPPARGHPPGGPVLGRRHLVVHPQGLNERLAGRIKFKTTVAEGEGFEPPEAHHLGCFQDSCHQPDSAIPPRPRSVSLPRHRRPSPRDPTLTAGGK